jgi:hypothetical protein
LAFKSNLARFSDVEDVSLAGISDDFGNLRKEATFRSKMNDELSISHPDFRISGFGIERDNLLDGDAF